MSGSAALGVHVASEAGRVPVSRARVASVARAVLRSEGVPSAMLSITFTTPRRIAALNRRYLAHSGATDVIAFGFRTEGQREGVVGDIYIAPSVARTNAHAHGVGVREELLRLVVHGTLHVLGYDHPPGPERVASGMWRRQEVLLARALRAGTAP